MDIYVQTVFYNKKNDCLIAKDILELKIKNKRVKEEEMSIFQNKTLTCLILLEFSLSRSLQVNSELEFIRSG